MSTEDTPLIAVIPATEENRPALLKLALSMFLGESCKYCQRVYKTFDDLEDTVWAGEHERGRLACKACWDKANPDNLSEEKE